VSACARNKLPSIRTVHLLLAPALIFIAACLDRQYQTDFWHHLARGQQIIRLHHLLDIDVFTFTVAGSQLRDANWLTQVIYWRLFSWGGLNCVQVVNAGLLALTLLVLVRICWKVQSSSRIAAMVGAAVFLGLTPFALIRPQTGSFLLFVLLLGVLMSRQRRPGAIWLSAPIMALWANVHGGFAIGLVLVGTFFLSAIVRAFVPLPIGRSPLATDRVTDRADAIRLLLLLALCVAATFINPYGWTIYQYAATVTARASGRGIEEWLPPTLGSAGGWVLLLWFLALSVSGILARRCPTLLQVCLLACFVPLACRSVRMVPWVLLATAPMMAEFAAAMMKQRARMPQVAVLLDLCRQAPLDAQVCEYSDPWHPERERPTNEEFTPRPSLSAAVLLIFLLVAAIGSLPWLAHFNPLFGTVRSAHRVEDDLRVAASEMATIGAGRVFTRLEWGDYLSFAAHGENPVFCDGRIELYPDPIWKQYIQISAGRADAQGILDHWAVDYLLLDAQYHVTLLERMGRNGSWKTVWRSGQVVLLARTAALTADRKNTSQLLVTSR
jgi:hypothetical protein